MRDKHQDTEEPCEFNGSCTVLKSNGSCERVVDFTRSAHDAIEAIFITVCKKPKFVLDADISKCFDRIDQQKLLEKINTFPTIRRQLRAWLKAGVMDGKQLFPTTEGTPQGGVISPLLANIALHGMEERIKQFAETLVMFYPSEKKIAIRDRRESLSLIRYADDFVITHEDPHVIKRCKEIIADWLKGMGLELKPSKTRITHTLFEYKGEKPGFEFLGFNVRQYHVGKHQSKKRYKTLIKPSEESIRRHYKKIAEIIDEFKSSNQESLITKLNPLIIGWGNYYSARVSKDAYEKLDDLIFHKLFYWGKHRHPNKGSKWIVSKYWHTIGGDNWVFANKVRSDAPLLNLIKHSSIPIVRKPKVKGRASPFDGNLVYWSTRLGKNPELPKKVARLLKEQKGKCAYCNLYLQEKDVLEIDHIIPRSKGGRDTLINTQLLHRHCHDTKTTHDGSLGGQVCMTIHQNTEEPDEGKLSRPVLETSLKGDFPA